MSFRFSPVFFIAFAVCAVVVPLIGGAILRLMFKLMKTPGVTYVRCWLAYLAAWLTASILCTALFVALFNMADPTTLHLNLVVTVGIASHLIIVPLVMRVGWGKAAAAQLLTIVTYTLLLLPAGIVLANHLRGKAERILAVNSLRTIGNGMAQHLDVHQALPADAIYSKDGKPLLSWRVALLPYIEQQPLYEQFHLDEPWDSPHNLALLPKMPAVYRMPGVESQPGMTHFEVFVQTWSPGPPPTQWTGTPPFGRMAYNAPPMRVNQERLASDGTPNTLLVVEAGDAVPWTKPTGLPFGPGLPLPTLGAANDGYFAAVFCDMHTQLLPATLDERTLRGIITFNGSEAVSLP